MNNKISIIIPAYNAEKRIKKCLDSILNQSYKNIEIIIINDGSTDNTLNVIKQYDFKNIPYKIINKKNEGVSIARNIGIDKSNGEFILFLDSDDTIEPNILNNLIKKFNINTDIIKTSYYLEYKNKKVAVNEDLDEKYVKKSDIKKYINDLLLGKIHGFSSLFIIRKSLVVNKNIKYPENIKFMEDLIFILQILENSKEIYISKDKLLNYYQSNSSVSKSINIEKRIEGINNRYNYCIKYFKNSKSNNKEEFLNMIVSMYLKTEKYVLKNNNILENNELLIKNINFILKNNSFKMNLSNKCLYLLIKNNHLLTLKLFVLVYNLYSLMKGTKNND